MPKAKLKGVQSLRVPVDDDIEDDLLIYLDDVATVIHHVEKAGCRTIVHCMAGASRSSTLVIAYLIKYQEYSLKNAFLYIKSLRPCARPNISFFEQLIKYESFYRKRPLVAMETFTENGKRIKMPDFYRKQLPSLYRIELEKQLKRSHKSQLALKLSNNGSYINRNRGVDAMMKDFERIRGGNKDNDNDRNKSSQSDQSLKTRKNKAIITKRIEG